MKVKVVVMPKATVLDPQGNAVRDAMRHLGMPEVRSVRIGKYMEIDVDGKNGEVESRLHGLCRDLLSNPVIEDYELQQIATRIASLRLTALMACVLNTSGIRRHHLTILTPSFSQGDLPTGIIFVAALSLVFLRLCKL